MAGRQATYQTGLVAAHLSQWQEAARRPGAAPPLVEEEVSLTPRLLSLSSLSTLETLLLTFHLAAPAWSSGNTARTPAWQQSSTTGSRTPAYAPADGSRTVNPYTDGSRTVNPYATGSNRTPAWNPTATSSSYSHDPFAGSRTPAYDSSHSNSSGAKGGRAYDAPTPGKDFAAAAPTPGATNGYVGHTPAAATAAATAAGGGGGGGGGGVAGQTPKFSGDAPTPFSGLPGTPGWSGGGEDAGPRYEEGTPSP